MAALSVFHALVNCLNTAWLSKIASTYAVIHIAVLFSCCVALLVLQKDKNSASYVFTEVHPDSGWNPPGFSFLFGFLSVAWGKFQHTISRAWCPVSLAMLILTGRLRI